MKNIKASVGVVPTQEKKQAEVKEGKEKEYTWKFNETLFYLQENPDCYLVAGGEWHGTARGGVVGSVDIYFRHILTGARCESAWGCLVGWSECDQNSTEKWETLCQRIEDLPNLEETICDEKRVEV